MAKRREDKPSIADPVRDRLSAPSPMERLATAAASRPKPQLQPVEVLVPEPKPQPVKRQAKPEAVIPRVASQPLIEPEQEQEQEKNATKPRKRVQKSPGPEKADQVKKTRFTLSEAEDNERIVRLIRSLTGTKASVSGITRVLWSLLRASEQELKMEARGGLEMYRPPNGTSLEMASYEDDLGRFLLGALKSLDR